MKKLIISLLIIFYVGTLSAQLNITLNMSNRPTSILSEWSFRRDVLSLLVMNQSPVGIITAKLKTEIRTTDGTVIATTNMSKVPVMNFTQGTATVLNSGDVVNLSTLQFTGSYQSKLNRTGKLPAGNYILSVQFFAPDVPQKLSEEKTKTFFLATLQLPVLILPAEGAQLNADIAQTAITFRWTALNPVPIPPARYRIQVFEVLQDQQPVQAMRSNQPLLDKEVIGTTQFIWRPQLDLKLDSSRKFIWSIQALDGQGQPLSSDNATGEARSEPKSFMIINKPAAGKLGKRINNGL